MRVCVHEREGGCVCVGGGGGGGGKRKKGGGGGDGKQINWGRGGVLYLDLEVLSIDKRWVLPLILRIFLFAYTLNYTIDAKSH